METYRATTSADPPGPNGTTTQIPLSEVATVKLVSGASYIYREGQERYLPIKFSVRDRDLGSAIQEAQRKISEQVQLPPGSRMEWVGEFGNLQGAIARLKLVVPLSLALIALLLWINFGSVPDTILAMSVIPMAVIGGISSIPGALLGAFYLLWTGWYVPSEWRFIVTGFGVLIVLLIMPSGLGGVIFRLRDLWLRSVAKRREIVVPSMVADTGGPEPPAPPPPIEDGPDPDRPEPRPATVGSGG